MRVRSCVAALAAMLLAGCESGSLPTGGVYGLASGVHISTLASSDGHPAIEAPDLVQAYQAFTASFSTLTRGCDQPADLVVADAGPVITLRPFNRDTRAAGEMCPAYVTFTTRSAEVRFTTPGVDTLRAVGYLAGPDGRLRLDSIALVVVVSPSP